MGSNASTQAPGTGVLKLENLSKSGNYKQSVISSLTMMNTSPTYKSLSIPTPYGTLLDIKVQPSGVLFSPGRPICESLEQWRTTSFFVDALRNIDPNNKDLDDTAIGKGVLGATGYCQGNDDFDRMKCEFGTPQAACSCNDYGTKHLLNRCNEMFEIPQQTHEALTIEVCKNRLKDLITKDNVIAPKIARPYALTLGETYLCLNIPEANRKACNDKVTQTISSMSDKECAGLYTALGPDAAKYLANPRNQKNLESYPWFKLYNYHAHEFKAMFGETDLQMQPKALVRGRSCQQQIRGVLEDMVAQLNRDHLNEVEKLNASTATEQSQLKNRIQDLCTSQSCKKNFSDRIIRNFATPTSDVNLSSKRASEMKDLSSLYRDLTVYNNLNQGYCTNQSKNNTSPTIGAPPQPLIPTIPTGPMSPLGTQ